MEYLLVHVYAKKVYFNLIMIQDVYRTNTKHKKSNFTNYIIDTPDPLELLA